MQYRGTEDTIVRISAFIPNAQSRSAPKGRDDRLVFFDSDIKDRLAWHPGTIRDGVRFIESLLDCHQYSECVFFFKSIVEGKTVEVFPVNIKPGFESKIDVIDLLAAAFSGEQNNQILDPDHIAGRVLNDRLRLGSCS